MIHLFFKCCYLFKHKLIKKNLVNIHYFSNSLFKILKKWFFLFIDELLFVNIEYLHIEYHHIFTGEDWPGFSTPLIRNDSLWDNDYSPMENTWSTAVDSTPHGNVC